MSDSSYFMIMCVSQRLIIFVPDYLGFGLTINSYLKDNSFTFINRLIFERLKDVRRRTRCLKTFTKHRGLLRFDRHLAYRFGLSHRIDSCDAIQSAVVLFFTSIFDQRAQLSIEGQLHFAAVSQRNIVAIPNDLAKQRMKMETNSTKLRSIYFRFRMSIDRGVKFQLLSFVDMGVAERLDEHRFTGCVGHFRVAETNHA